ncbi:hypothetical protein [Kingella sp. (in: b-proteobacteria)]|uniref:hypothetical protein n=1 Tax=Kingella sp. (in: b-proteobacteria) TaxID=2020713 RepID=UPI0026DAF531|nr:hypothetical protein [Kingella sp. (in: b-proteobacteria)]MDO4657767.1 hypothetical protein [Kingella sp. (in: b-proteobacteria)]
MLACLFSGCLKCRNKPPHPVQNTTTQQYAPLKMSTQTTALITALVLSNIGTIAYFAAHK